MSRQLVVGGCVFLLVATAGCGAKEGSSETEVQSAPVRRATAFINPRSGSDMGGSAIFINEGGRVELQVSLEQAPPGEHAVHIHQTGDCSAEDASSAGGHWNPTAEDH